MTTGHTPMISIQHLSKRYGATLAVDDVSFAIDRGSIFISQRKPAHDQRAYPDCHEERNQIANRH